MEINEVEQKLSDLYRRRSENAEAIIKLLDENKEISLKLRKVTEEIRVLQRKTGEVDDVLSEITEFSKNLTISKVHLSGERKELERTLDSLLETNKDLSATNLDLVQRMLNMKCDQIAKMNEMNDLEKTLKIKESELTQFEVSINSESILSEYEFVDPFDNSIYESSKFKSNKPPRKKNYFLQGHEVEGTTLTYNNSGSYFLSSGNENIVKVWDSCSSLEKPSLRGFSQSIISISVSPTDDIVMLGSSNCSAYALGSFNGKVKHTLTGHCGKVTGVGFIRSNLEAVTSSEDKTVKIWSLDKGYCVNTISTPSTIYALIVDNEDHTIITGHKDGAVRVHTAKSKKVMQSLDVQRSSISSCSRSPCGNYLAITTRDHAVLIKDLRMGELLWKLTHKLYNCPGLRSSTSFSSDSKMFTAGSFNGDIITWSVANGEVETVINGSHKKPVLAVCWSPCESQLASIDSGGFIGVWS